MDFGEHARRVGHGLNEMPADDEIERPVVEQKRERITALKPSARSESGAARSGTCEVILIEIDADKDRGERLCGESGSDFTGPASDVEYRATADRMPLENLLLLRPDRLGLRSEVPHH